jgi:antitoxin (DNA-binding transcriptional repressor) of toxin-antitoxin stability system
MQHRITCLLRRALFLFGVAISLQTALIAQRGTHVTKRVSFQPGHNSTVITGRARWGTRYIYLLRARAGQTLSVQLEGVPVMRIIPPDAKNYEALKGADIVRDWSGALPKTGDYQIDVGHTDDQYGTAPFKLEIKIE